jgi:hypothetical protein
MGVCFTLLLDIIFSMHDPPTAAHPIMYVCMYVCCYYIIYLYNNSVIKPGTRKESKPPEDGYIDGASTTFPISSS